MDISSLSEEQLVELLRKKREQKLKNIPITKPEKQLVEQKFDTCQYKPKRSGRDRNGNKIPPQQCTNKSEVSWRFCKRHRNTVQSKRAQKEYNSRKTKTETKVPQSQAQQPVESKPIQQPVESKPIQQPVESKPIQQPVESKPIQQPVESKPIQQPESKPIQQPVESKPVQPQTVQSSVKTETQQTPTKIPAKKIQETIEETEKTIVEKPNLKKRLRKHRKGKPRPVIRKKVIKPNAWGRFEDTDTHIIFDPVTKSAYGIQESNGMVSALTPKHIDICERNGWNYTKPVYESDSGSEVESYSDDEQSEDDIYSESDEQTDSDGDSANDDGSYESLSETESYETDDDYDYDSE